MPINEQKTVIFQDLGVMDYQQAWDYQTRLHRELVDNKLTNCQRVQEGAIVVPQQHYLLFCEHPPVYTLGKSAQWITCCWMKRKLEEEGFSFYKINRGGDITYHGPGQIVGYPIFDLDCFFTDVHQYVRYLEEVIIRTLSDYGLEVIAKKTTQAYGCPNLDYFPNGKYAPLGYTSVVGLLCTVLLLMSTPSWRTFSISYPAVYRMLTRSDEFSTGVGSKFMEMEEVKQRGANILPTLFGFQYAPIDRILL
ncbi:MAG: lipoyl(octanoyl) transferase [Saprospiraceae bacterium]